MAARGLSALALAVLLIGGPAAALAAASGKTFPVTVASTVSGVFQGKLAFETTGAFVFTPNVGQSGSGTFTEAVNATTGMSSVNAIGTDGKLYQGLFIAHTQNTTISTSLAVTIISGIGVGNAHDLFLFVGYVPTTAAVAAIPPRAKR